jgi:hypothetical protein
MAGHNSETMSNFAIEVQRVNYIYCSVMEIFMRLFFLFVCYFYILNYSSIISHMK